MQKRPIWTQTGRFHQITLLPEQVQNLIDQDLVRVFELISKWNMDADRSARKKFRLDLPLCMIS